MATESFDMVVLAADGEAAPADELARAMVLDLEFFPAFAHKPRVSGARVTLPLPASPFAVSVPLDVEGFGHVHVYADNGGEGYRTADVADGPLDFAWEAARSRALAVRRAEARFAETGTRPSSESAALMEEAESLLEDARAEPPAEAARARSATASLARSLEAGERLVVEHARHLIASRPPREGFRFGCNGFAYPQRGEPYAKLFGACLDFVTLPFYRARTEPTEGTYEFSPIEKILEWTERDGLDVKGHPLVWFHRAGIPEWLKGRSYEKVAAAHRRYIADAVGRFGDRVKTWDVLNEAHDWANDFGYDRDRLVEMTRLAAEATGEADPQATRIVNSCCTWSEYVARGRDYSKEIGRPARNVLQYVRDVIDAGVEFEVVGLQMYYPARDLFEIDRHLEMFCRLGKPVHITELGVSSSCRPIEGRPDDRPGLARYWHGRPWSEREQADWVEAYYTLCYAKPAIKAITWWNFCDPAFIAHGGLVDEDLRPKEAYHRLKALIEGWR